MLEKLPPDHVPTIPTYTVEYRHVTEKNCHLLTKVILDGSYPGIPDIRWFLLKDQTRVDVPTPNMVITFSPERHKMVLEGEKLKKKAEEAKRKADEATELEDNE